MTETAELHTRLLQEARNYDPAAHNRGLLAPYRDVLLLWRAKYMSYEQIAATLTSHGIKVSPAGVGVYCRNQFTKREINRARSEGRDTSGPGTPGRVPTVPGPLPALSAAPTPVPVSPPAVSIPNRRGPKIARDIY